MVDEADAEFDGIRELPLSLSQRSIWVSWLMNPQSRLHILCFPMLMAGDLDFDSLRASVAEIGTRHPILRSRIVDTVAGPRLRFSDVPAIPVSRTRTDLPLELACRQAATMQFDLTVGPLARVEIRHGDGYNLLILTVHHVVLDARSCALLFAQLRDLYRGATLRPVNNVPLLADFAEWQNAVAMGSAGVAHREFWRNRLTPPPPVPDFPAVAGSQDCAVFHTRLSADSQRMAGRVSRELGVRTLAIYHGAFVLLMYYHTGVSDLVVSTPYHGRTKREIRDQVGFFSNPLPLRHEVDPDGTYRTFMHKTLHELTTGIEHGDLSFPEILRAAGLSGPSARGCTNKFLFQYWNIRPRSEGVDLHSVEMTSGHNQCTLQLLPMEDFSDYMLAVMFRVESDGITMSWKDHGGVLGGEMLSGLAAAYSELLEEMLTYPNRRIGRSRGVS